MTFILYTVMPTNDIETFQSFCRKYVNKLVKEHFSDIASNDPGTLSLEIPRQAIKRVCLHEDTDPMMLTIGRLLLWWVEAKGLFEDVIYGIPSTDFEITNTYYPQVKLHFREDKYIAANNDRRPARSEVSFRWRENDYSTTNVNSLINQLVDKFARPIMSYKKGRTQYTYVDKSKGYYFQMNTDTEADAKKIIEAAIRIQDDNEPDWENNFREHKDNKNYTTRETIRVMGETLVKPKKRPIANVKFAFVELFIPGKTKPLVILDATGSKVGALRYL